MARLPTVGADDNDWGDILNEYLEVSHTDTGRHKFIVVSVAYAATITPNVDTADVLTIGTLTGNITIANPTGTPEDGQVLILRFLQDETGGRTVSWGNIFSFQTTTSSPSIPIAANARWEMAFRYNVATSKYELVSISSDEPTARAEIAYTTSIPFNRLVTKIASHTISGATTFTPNTIGALPGCGATLELTADGVHTPDFSAFTEFSSSSGWDNTTGKVNFCVFYYSGDRYAVAITQYDILTPLNAPGSFSAVTVSTTQVNLTWTDVSNESSYEIQRGVAADYSDAVTINSPAANATSYNNTGLTASVHYYYRIRAIGDNVTYSNSSWVTANATTTSLVQLITPSSFAADVISGSEIDLSWTDTNTSPNESGYKIYRNTTNNFGSATLVTTKAIDSVSHQDTGLSATTTYYYWILAAGDGSLTSDSTTATASATTTDLIIDSDAQAYIDALVAAGANSSEYNSSGINDMFLSWKSSGYWTKATRIFLMIYSSQAPNLINLKSVGTHDLTLTNPASPPTWSTTGASGFDTSTPITLYPDITAADLTQDDVHLGGLVMTANTPSSPSTMECIAALVNSTDDICLRLGYGSGGFVGSVFGEVLSAQGSFSATIAAGLDLVSRINNSQEIFYRNGNILNTRNISSKPLSDFASIPMEAAAQRDELNRRFPFSSNSLGFLTLGLGLSDSMVTALNNSLKTYMTIIGNNVIA